MKLRHFKFILILRMNIDIQGDAQKTVNIGPGDKSGSLFSLEKPSPAIPLASRPPPGPAAPRPAAPRPPPAPVTRVADAQDMLHDFANPVKDTGGAGGNPFQGDDSDSLTSGDDSLTDGSGDDKTVSDFVVDEQPEYDEDRPSPGFASIDDEKSHILWKLSRAKRNGMPVHRNLTIDSNIRELRNELKRVEYELSLSQSLRFQKRMLCLAVSGMEVLTERYSLFDLQLAGWSSSVQDDIDSFDGVLTRLHDKYKDRAAMPPELQLLLMLVSSAVSFHVTKSMMKSLSQPGGGGLGGLLQSMMGGAPKAPTASVQEMPSPQASAGGAPPAPPERGPQTVQRAPMRGPSMGPGLFPSPMAPEPMAPPAMTDRGQKRARDDSDKGSDRVSDIVSDDSSSEGPSESSSDEDDQALKIQTIPTAGGRGRGRGRGRGAGRGAAKTVVTL